MRIDEFAAVIRTRIGSEGFDEFYPSACLPARRNIRALVGLPKDEDQETAALEWISEIAEPTEEVLVAFKISATQFKIIRRVGSAQKSRIYRVPT